MEVIIRLYNFNMQGDGGGPMVIKQIGTGSWMQIGIVSFIHSSGCQSGYPNGYTSTSYHSEWIQTTCEEIGTTTSKVTTTRATTSKATTTQRSTTVTVKPTTVCPTVYTSTLRTTTQPSTSTSSTEATTETMAITQTNTPCPTDKPKPTKVRNNLPKQSTFLAP